MAGTDRYNEYCERSISDLYRMAFLIYADQERACAAVLDTCVKGAKTLRGIASELEVKIALTGLLYRRCRRLWFYIHDTGKLPALLQAASHRERLILAVRFGAGLRSEEARQATGLTKTDFYHRLADAAQAIRVSK